jgi:lysozyme-like protein
MAESGGDPNARCFNCAGVPEDSRGLGQINVMANTQFAHWDLFDPAQNAEAAFQIWQQQGWGAWSTYTSGRYLAFAGATLPSAAPGIPLQLVDPTTGALSPRVLLIAAAIAAAYLLMSN